MALLVLAAGLRGVVLAAYHPALIFPDSVRYLQYAHNFADGRWSPDGLRQSGYSILIIPAVVWFVKVQGALNRYWEGKASAAAAAAAPA